MIRTQFTFTQLTLPIVATLLVGVAAPYPCDNVTDIKSRSPVAIIVFAIDPPAYCYCAANSDYVIDNSYPCVTWKVEPAGPAAEPGFCSYGDCGGYSYPKECKPRGFLVEPDVWDESCECSSKVYYKNGRLDPYSTVSIGHGVSMTPPVGGVDCLHSESMFESTVWDIRCADDTPATIKGRVTFSWYCVACGW